jgi:methyl-accepting chemotaxis protein
MKTAADQAVVGMNKASEVFVTQTKPCLRKVQELLGQATERISEVTTKANEGMVASARSTKLSVSVLSLVAIAIGVVAAVFIARGIISALKRIIDSLNEGSEQVAAASGQVSSSSQSLAEGATEQAAGLEETSSSLEEMSSMTKQNADNAMQANTLASEARKAADTGTESMGRMNAAIQDIQRSSDETAKIIKVIDEIAFQTNLLALNAAVEAARAGEAGKGFAVVAEEVRNLAMRSAEAAKNTASMIAESVKSSKNGVDIANEVTKVLDDIVQGVGKTTDLVSEIAAASQEQAQGIDQVNTAVAQMDKVTQQNAANAEESASASEELSAQAESMNDIVAQLVTLVGGSSTAARRTGRARRPDVRSHHGFTNRELGKSDETFHTIAHKSNKTWNPPKVSSRSTADKVIPLDGDEFDDFNT